MLNFINKILNYFGYTLTTTTYILSLKLDIDTLNDKVLELDSTNFKLFKEKDRLINLAADKDKDIKVLEHKVNNLQWIVEEDRLTIEDLNKQSIELGDENADIETRLSNLDKVCKDRYKEINLLRSRVKALTESRDNYKTKYKQLCWKIALKKACPKQ